jgi:glucose-6-phosphate isomerase
MQKLLALAETAQLQTKIEAMFTGEHINTTEDRAVLHTALRAPRKAVVEDEGQNVVPEVWKVLDKIKDFSDRVRSGEWLGETGKPLKNVVCVGIGGSYLGPLFVHTALATDQSAMQGAAGRVLRFLANVDPIDVAKALKGVCCLALDNLCSGLCLPVTCGHSFDALSVNLLETLCIAWLLSQTPWWACAPGSHVSRSL